MVRCQICISVWMDQEPVTMNPERHPPNLQDLVAPLAVAPLVF